MKFFPTKDADMVKFTPTAHIEATDVQAALEELDGELRQYVHSYGVSWDEDADTYVRTGATAGQPAGQSLVAGLLPIQSAMRRCILNDSGGVEYYLGATDSTKREDGVTASDLTGTDGQVMVQIPAFYYKYGYSGTTHTWEISLTPGEGFSRHHAFIKNGVDVDYRYIGAYEGILYDTSASRYTNGVALGLSSPLAMTFTNATSVITCTTVTRPFTNLEAGDKFVVSVTMNNNGTFTVSSTTDQTITTVEALTDETAGNTVLKTEKNWGTDVLSSVSGKAPINYGTRANFRAAAATRGTGWRQQDYDLISAIQLLYIVEYASWYSQSMIGNGFTSFGNGWSALNSYNPIETTGNSNGDGNTTAGVDNGWGATGSYMSYRGIENFYGHLWKWVDGVNTNNAVPYVSNDDTVFADDTTVNYTDLGITLFDDFGYPITLKQTARGVLPASLGASSHTYVTDMVTVTGSGWRLYNFGGAVSSGGAAGVASISIAGTSSGISPITGGRLSF